MADNADKQLNVTQKQLEGIALAAGKEAAQETVTKLMAVLGVNFANIESVEEFRKDLAFSRKYRNMTDAAGRRAVLTLVTMVSGGIGIAVWEYFKSLRGP